MPTNQEPLALLQSRLKAIDPEKLRGINGCYRISVLGEGGGDFDIQMVNGELDLEGRAPNDPNITLTLSFQHFVDLMDGKLDLTLAYLSGKMKVAGDQSMGIHLKKILQEIKSKTRERKTDQ